jgi:hypothetical protein
MQVKAISGSVRAPGDVPSFVADGVEVTSVTVVEGSPLVSVAVPVSLALLEAACWTDRQESSDSVVEMSDDDVREWALSQLLTHGVLTTAVETDGFAPRPATAESAAYLAVIRERLPRAFGLVCRELAGSAA